MALCLLDKWAMEPTIGDLIRAYLDGNRRTQGELAGDLGVSPSAISRWISGQRLPGRHLIALARLLGKDVDDLLRMWYAEQDDRTVTQRLTLEQMNERLQQIEERLDAATRQLEEGRKHRQNGELKPRRPRKS